MNTAKLALGTVLVAAALVAMPGAPATADPGMPVLVGHGASVAFAPENSVPALDGYAALGVTMFEVDVRWAKNDPGPSAMASHDEDVSSKTTCNGNMANNWFGTLRACSAADYAPWNTDPLFSGNKPDGTPKVPVMYAYDYLSAAQRHGARLLLDMKTQPTQTQMANFMTYVDRPEFNLAGQTPMRQRIVWMSNSPEQLTQARGWYPDLTYWLLQNESAMSMKTCAALSGIGASGYAVQNYRIDVAKVSYWHTCAPGFVVATWTTNSANYEVPAEWQRVRDSGVDYIITNNPTSAALALAPPPQAPAQGRNTQPLLQLPE